MANFSSQYRSSSSSSSVVRRTTTTPQEHQHQQDVSRSNIQASAYTVDAASMALKGFHYSTCGAGGAGWWATVPSPPQSPRAAPLDNTKASHVPVRPNVKVRSRSGGAAYHITEESERLFCETLKTVFLGEGNTIAQDSLVMDMRINNKNDNDDDDNACRVQRQQFPPTPVASPGNAAASMAVQPVGGISGTGTGLVREWVEIWDYAGGLRFRGFVAEKDGERALFVFFDRSVIGKDLKQGLMSLLELSGGNDFGCEKLVACVDRTADDQADVRDLTRDLGWVGFELATLDHWSGGAYCTSQRWIFLEMEV